MYIDFVIFSCLLYCTYYIENVYKSSQLCIENQFVIDETIGEQPRLFVRTTDSDLFF